jgi:hypothetical protein
MSEIESKLRLERDMKLEIIQNASAGRHSISPDNINKHTKSDRSSNK